MLHGIKVDVYACRHSVDYTAHSGAVGFAERSQAIYVAKCIHNYSVIGVAMSATVALT